MLYCDPPVGVCPSPVPKFNIGGACWRKPFATRIHRLVLRVALQLTAIATRMAQRFIAGIRQPVLPEIARPILAALRRHHAALNERIHD